MQKDYGVVEHFSSVHKNYFSAWRYVTKSDRKYIQSEDHPDVANVLAPQTSKASRKRRGSVKQKVSNTTNNKTKKVKLTNSIIYDIIKHKNIKNRTVLNALAQTQKEEGKTDLLTFITNRSIKTINGLSTVSLEMAGAQTRSIRSKRTRMELLADALELEWLTSAIETIQRNKYSVEDFSRSVQTLLLKGRGKFWNIITGSANCGKTFLLKPITLIFKSFVNPAVAKMI